MLFKKGPASVVKDESAITVPLITVDLTANQQLLNKRSRDKKRAGA